MAKALVLQTGRCCSNQLFSTMNKLPYLIYKNKIPLKIARVLLTRYKMKHYEVKGEWGFMYERDAEIRHSVHIEFIIKSPAQIPVCCQDIVSSIFIYTNINTNSQL